QRTERAALHGGAEEYGDSDSRVDLQARQWRQQHPPEEVGGSNEGQVLEHVQRLVLERALVEHRRMPQPRHGAVSKECTYGREQYFAQRPYRPPSPDSVPRQGNTFTPTDRERPQHHVAWAGQHEQWRSN